VKSIFVFGSNLAGIHGMGSAAEAYRNHGAQMGVGKGLTGSSYAIPTKDADLLPLELKEIHRHVQRFIRFAKDHPDLRFHVVRVGCGLAGYMEEEIKPFFADAPGNCVLPEGWRAR
jgi:hypothetical protein